MVLCLKKNKQEKLLNPTQNNPTDPEATVTPEVTDPTPTPEVVPADPEAPKEAPKPKAKGKSKGKALAKNQTLLDSGTVRTDN